MNESQAPLDGPDFTKGIPAADLAEGASPRQPTTFTSRGFRFKGLAKADLGASYSLPLGDDRKQLRFFGYVDNLFDREYFESGFRTPGRTGRAGATFVF